MLSLEAITEHVRKTPDGLLSVYDVIAAVKECSQTYAGQVYSRLLAEERVPEFPRVLLLQNAGAEKRGGCRSSTPVADARGIVQLVWALPGKSEFRRQCADVCVRYLGGDPTLVEEIFKNRAAQEALAKEQPNHPARVFGEAVESEAIKRKREELVTFELDVQLMRARADHEDQATRYKKARISGIVEAYALAEIPLDDRARLQLRDLVGTITAVTPERQEICMREFLLQHKVPVRMQSQFGKKVAALKRKELTEAGLEPVIPKKRIECNGQVTEANLYFEDDKFLFFLALESRDWNA